MSDFSHHAQISHVSNLVAPSMLWTSNSLCLLQAMTSLTGSHKQAKRIVSALQGMCNFSGQVKMARLILGEIAE
jgi:hypothetical protein